MNSERRISHGPLVDLPALARHLMWQDSELPALRGEEVKQPIVVRDLTVHDAELGDALMQIEETPPLPASDVQGMIKLVASRVREYDETRKTIPAEENIVGATVTAMRTAVEVTLNDISGEKPLGIPVSTITHETGIPEEQVVQQVGGLHPVFNIHELRTHPDSKKTETILVSFYPQDILNAVDAFAAE